MKRKLYIRTYGCQMNVYDSARMADVLAPLGYAPTDAPDDADMILLNTCHIREKAAEKLFSDLGRLRLLKARKAQEGAPLVIGVAGCVAQAEGEEIVARAPFVDLVLGPQTYHRLPEMIAKLSRGGGPVLDTEFPPEPKFDHLPDSTAPQAVSAFLSVQEGCDKFCTFCVVPYTRGAEFSRPAASVIAEAERLIASGAREITLLGQNVNAYHGDRHGWRKLGPRAPYPRARRSAGARAAALYDLASARHERRVDRRASRRREADAVPASAGAIGLGCACSRR